MKACGCQSSTGLRPWLRFRATAALHTVGWGLQAPPRGRQGFLTLLIISIFMTRLVNKTSELATHIYLSAYAQPSIGRHGD